MKLIIGFLLIFVYIPCMAQSTENTATTEKVTIEIWSDVVCPFCIVGKKKMERAIQKLNAEDKVNIIWRSFQLDPDFPMDSSISTNEYLVERKGYPAQQVEMMSAHLVDAGTEYGIDFQFAKARAFNTVNAHRLIQWSKTYNKANELEEAIMKCYFSGGIDLSISENLITVVKEVGLDIEEATKLLATDEFKEEVNQDIYQSRQLGIRGVPYFLINETATISGAQDDKVFENVLAAALKNITLANTDIQAGTCIPNQECK